MLNQIFTAPFYRKGLPVSRLQSNLKEKSYLNTMTKEFPVFNFLTPKKKKKQSKIVLLENMDQAYMEIAICKFSV